MNAVLDYLNANPGQVAALAAIVAVGLQYLVNKFKELGTLTNYALALIAFPGFTAGVAAYTTNLHLTAYPVVVLIGQLLYAVLESYKNYVISKVVPTQAGVSSAVTTTPATTEY